MSRLQIAERPSPNHGERKAGLTPSLIVLHYTAMQTAEAALARLCDPDAEVSAHYLISNKGQITRLVPDDRRAWHAGAGSWAGQDDINSRSIGIELDNRGTHPFPEPQMAALESLLRALMKRWQIPSAGVIGHSDMAPGRKIDPGPHFDWTRLERQGLAPKVTCAAPPPNPVTADTFRAAAQSAGYTAPANDQSLLETVRLRRRPHATGPLTAADFPAPLILPPLIPRV